MIHLNKTTALIIGIAIIMFGNAVALIGVYYNRSGVPDAEVILTQRELRLPYHYGFESENSSIALIIQWQVDDDSYRYPSHWRHPAWLNKTKLQELGFDTSIPINTSRAAKKYRKMLPRNTFIVLEYDGPTYKTQLKQARDNLAKHQQQLAKHPGDKYFEKKVSQAEATLNNEENSYTRLFAVDAGPDMKTLRQKYPNRHMYIIASAQIRIVANYKGSNEPLSLTGTIQNLSIPSITAPYAIRKVLEPYISKNNYQMQHKLKYKATVVYGRRLEPWIKNLSIIQSGKK